MLYPDRGAGMEEDGSLDTMHRRCIEKGLMVTPVRFTASITEHKGFEVCIQSILLYFCPTFKVQANLLFNRLQPSEQWLHL